MLFSAVRRAVQTVALVLSCVIRDLLLNSEYLFIIIVIMSDTSDLRLSESSDEAVAGPSNVEVPSRRRRSKVPVPSEWKKIMAKTKRNLGKSYVSEKTGKDVSERKIGPRCSCSAKCFDVITMPVIKELFKNFWEMGSWELQNAYLSKLLVAKTVKRRRVPVTASSKFRSHQVQYTVMHGNKVHDVCKKAFLSVFGLGERRVQTVLRKQTRTGNPIPDSRGRLAPTVKVTHDRADSVRTHIRLLPAVSSHYTRAKSPERKYLTPDLSVVKLYALYQDYVTQLDPPIEPVSESYYRKVFTTEFNIGFAPARTDTCNTCDRLQGQIQHYDANQSPVPLEELQEVLGTHKEMARKGQNLLSAFSDDHGEKEEVLAACFDLQQTLPAPKLSSSMAYYKRKLWVYNLGIVNMKTKKATMYIWDEATAKRGSIEIASCLLHWINANYDPETHTDLLLYSDNCAGQNKNFNVVLLLLRLVHQKKFFNVRHHFLVPGHSYMPCDRQFGNIELNLRKHPNIETKADYVRLIRTAVRDGFNIVELEQSDFLDFNVMQDKKFVTKRKAKELNFQDARIVTFDVTFREGFKIQEDYDDSSPQHKIRLQPGRAAFSLKRFNLGEIELPPKYRGPIPLQPAKLDDLQQLLPLVQPPVKQNYFRKIIQDQHQLRHSQEDPDDPQVVDDEENTEDVEDNVLDYD